MARNCHRSTGGVTFDWWELRSLGRVSDCSYLRHAASGERQRRRGLLAMIAIRPLVLSSSSRSARAPQGHLMASTTCDTAIEVGSASPR